MIDTSVKQRPELTFKHNKKLGRHGWLRLTPAYSVKLVEKVLEHYPSNISVFDPFSGTATTLLTASSLGHNSFGLDINPFLVWLGNVKIAKYGTATIQQVKERMAYIKEQIEYPNSPLVEPPKIHNIERWWGSEALDFLCKFKALIDTTTNRGTKVRDILYVVFSRTMIEVSYAAFNHQSMSFKDDTAEPISKEECQGILDFYFNIILSSMEDNPKAEAKVFLGDSRRVCEHVKEQYDLLLTSPPYPNRMSYIRELRPYMYWLGYIKEKREAGELDWKAIGGTWGCATSNLNSWQRDVNSYSYALLKETVDDISHSDNKNGKVMSAYILKYFEDVEQHLKSIYPVIKENGKVAYIVGNSTFYGVLLPVEKIYASLLSKYGFKNVQTTVIRKRNSKKALYEFLVEGNK